MLHGNWAEIPTTCLQRVAQTVRYDSKNLPAKHQFQETENMAVFKKMYSFSNENPITLHNLTFDKVELDM